MKSLRTLSLIAGTICSVSANVLAQNLAWIQHTNISAISAAYSSDGSKIVVAQSPGSIYTSMDYGITWTQQTSAPTNTYWSSVATSSDGQKLVAAQSSGFIYTSTNYGSTWTRQNNAGSNYWSCVGSSDNGNRLIAGQGGAVGLGYAGGYVYISTDSGVSWTPTGLGFDWWQSIATSSDGSQLIAKGGSIYRSTNFGVSWTQQSTWPGANMVACSSDGSHLILVQNGGPVFTSTNYGAAWKQQMNAPSANWKSVASSSDGSHIAVVGGAWGSIFDGSIYTSADYGVTWQRQAGAGLGYWLYVASSSDGNHLVAGQLGGGIYTANYLGKIDYSSSGFSGNCSFNLHIAGTPGYPYVLQATTNLVPPVNWQSVITNTADTNGNSTFTDTNAPSSQARFYRISVP